MARLSLFSILSFFLFTYFFKLCLKQGYEFINISLSCTYNVQSYANLCSYMFICIKFDFFSQKNMRFYNFIDWLNKQCIYSGSLVISQSFVDHNLGLILEIFQNWAVIDISFTSQSSPRLKLEQNLCPDRWTLCITASVQGWPLKRPKKASNCRAWLGPTDFWHHSMNVYTIQELACWPKNHLRIVGIWKNQCIRFSIFFSGQHDGTYGTPKCTIGQQRKYMCHWTVEKQACFSLYF